MLRRGRGREEKVMGDKCVYRDGSVISVHFVFFFFFMFSCCGKDGARLFYISLVCTIHTYTPPKSPSTI